MVLYYSLWFYSVRVNCHFVLSKIKEQKLEKEKLQDLKKAISLLKSCTAMSPLALALLRCHSNRAERL